MEASTLQVRSLTIERTGDFFSGKVIPKIRLCGKWLEQAGFKPGHRVQVYIERAGSITLRFVEQEQKGTP
jgi:hypothetical protein